MDLNKLYKFMKRDMHSIGRFERLSENKFRFIPYDLLRDIPDTLEYLDNSGYVFTHELKEEGEHDEDRSFVICHDFIFHGKNDCMNDVWELIL